MKQLKDSLYLVDLDQPVTGFRRFISSWILVSQGRAVIIDPGPASTINHLVKALKDLEVKSIEAVILTHIHIDHAGGVGDLLSHYPGTPVLCHERGIRHMVEPSRLWEGSKKVLGSLAETYGPIKPVPAELLFYDTNVSFAGFDFEIIETPGHAKHHLSIVSENILFAGEALGTFIPARKLYIRVATPPVFDYNEYAASIERLSKFPVKTVCFAHYGFCNKPKEVIKTTRKQLDLWVDVIRKNRDEEKAIDQIMRQDPLMKVLEELPEDIRKRELYFIGNSVRGILGSENT